MGPWNKKNAIDALGLQMHYSKTKMCRFHFKSSVESRRLNCLTYTEKSIEFTNNKCCTNISRKCWVWFLKVKAMVKKAVGWFQVHLIIVAPPHWRLKHSLHLILFLEWNETQTQNVENDVRIQFQMQFRIEQ